MVLQTLFDSDREVFGTTPQPEQRDAKTGSLRKYLMRQIPFNHKAVSTHQPESTIAEPLWSNKSVLFGYLLVYSADAKFETPTNKKAVGQVALGLSAGLDHARDVELNASSLSAKEHALEELKFAMTELEQTARTDPLTGIANRGELYSRTLIEFLKLSRHSREAEKDDSSLPPMCALMLDIDHFKGVNDTYSHPAGDLVLQQFTDRINRSLRPGDIFGRVGGEEFVIILPNTSIQDTEKIAERIRRSIAAAPFLLAEGHNEKLQVTVSIGMSSLDPARMLGPAMLTKDDMLGPKALLAEADEALYYAKHNGRDQVVRNRYRNGQTGKENHDLFVQVTNRTSPLRKAEQTRGRR